MKLITPTLKYVNKHFVGKKLITWFLLEIFIISIFQVGQIGYILY